MWNLWKLKVQTAELRRFGDYFVNFEQILYIALMFLLLTLTK